MSQPSVRLTFFGTSQTAKPAGFTDSGTSVPVGSTFEEADTGNIFEWDGVNWRAAVSPAATGGAGGAGGGGSGASAVTAAAVENLMLTLRLLRVEVAALRLGMIEATTCAPVAQEYAESEMMTWANTTR